MSEKRKTFVPSLSLDSEVVSGFQKNTESARFGNLPFYVLRNTVHKFSVFLGERFAIDSCFLFLILSGWDFPLTLAKIENRSRFTLVFMRVKILPRLR